MRDFMSRVRWDSPQRNDCRRRWGIHKSSCRISGIEKLRGSEIELNRSVVAIIGLPWVVTRTRLVGPMFAPHIGYK